MSIKKILVTTTTFPSFLEGDSTPPFVYELSKRLAKKNDLMIFVSTPYIKNSQEYEEKDNLKIYRFKYGFTSLRDGAILPNIQKNKLLIFQIPFFLLFSFLKIASIVKKEKIDIIHTHWIIPQGFLAVLYKKVLMKKHIKLICTVHGGDIFSLKGRFMTLIKKWTLENVDQITVVSNEIKDELQKMEIKNNNNITVMPMGVDNYVFNSNKYDKELKRRYNINGPFLLFVGRLVEKKGISHAICAMAMIVKKYSTTKLIIVGTGPLEKALKKQVSDLKLENNVIFAGGIPNQKLPNYYATANIFVGPSVTASNGDSEGFGLTFVEALFCKCPVIASDLKAISDIIINKKTGIQIEVKNTELFANKIIELLGDENKRKKLAENGYNYVKNNFTWDISKERYYNVILSLSKDDCTINKI